MGSFRFDWRLVGVIAVIIILASSGRLPWPVVALALGVAGGYLLRYGWRVWGGGSAIAGRRKVTYWRGQRIEIEPARRGPNLPSLNSLGPAALYLLLGAVFVLAAASITLDQLGVF
jgi:hypothetical protein